MKPSLLSIAVAAASLSLISAEAMAMGTPVVCYIREDLEEFGKDLPIYRANKTNLVKILENLIQNLK